MDGRKSLAVNFSSEKDNFSSDAQSFYLHKTFVSFIAHQQKLNWWCRMKCCCCWEKSDSSNRNSNWYRQPALNTRNQFVYSCSVQSDITVDICDQKFTMEISAVVQSCCCCYLIKGRCTEGRPEVQWGRMMGVQTGNTEALYFIRLYSISNYPWFMKK